MYGAARHENYTPSPPHGDSDPGTSAPNWPGRLNFELGPCATPTRGTDGGSAPAPTNRRAGGVHRFVSVIDSAQRIVFAQTLQNKL